ncbi:uncharacterized protein LOC142605945 [Castanea sativa]|uniref:uncharacterized protein LOC142605945 n=1 Tax=Castanea sativa TaxID=21020 RepID=UPI003F649512
MIQIWDDKWLPTPTTYKVISHPQDFNDFPMVISLIDEDSKCWKSNLVRELFLPFEAETILRIPLSFSLPDDKIIWVGNRRGEFSVKSAYHIAVDIVDTQAVGKCSSGDVRAPLWRKLWHLNLPPKIKIFAWRACKNALPTIKNLQSRGVVVGKTCPLCSHDCESTSRALIHSEFAAKDLKIFLSTAWFIWYNRNQIIHEATARPAIQIWESAQRLIQDFINANSICPQQVYPSQPG